MPETDPDYYTVRLAVEVLSGGMSGRLFTEVREKRGLCYNVWAGYSQPQGPGQHPRLRRHQQRAGPGDAGLLHGELHRLSEGVTEAELERAKTGLKAGTIMQGESTSARAGAIAHDYFIRGRIRTLEEIKAAIDGVTRRSGERLPEGARAGAVHDRDGGAEGVEAAGVNSSAVSVGNHCPSNGREVSEQIARQTRPLERIAIRCKRR